MNVAWHVVPIKGTSGGILVGLKESTFSLLSCQNFEFGTTIMVKNNVDDFVSRLVVIYGSPYDEKKMEFLEELHLIMAGWQGPTILGGDFNIVRSQKEKSNELINFNIVSQKPSGQFLGLIVVSH
jgi:hypothetical protein